MGVAWESKKWSMVEENIPGISHSLVNSQSIPPLAWYHISIKYRLSHIAATSCGLLLPRLGVLAVFLPPRILKKPFPKDERAFLEPKLSSSVVAGKVAEGLMGGFSLILLTSSLVFWEKIKTHYFYMSAMFIHTALQVLVKYDMCVAKYFPLELKYWKLYCKDL